MVNLSRLIQYPLLKQGLLCFVFIGLLTSTARAGLGGPPNVTVQPVVLSLDGIVTNGGIAVINATVTSITSLTLAWYCNGKPVPAGKCTVANVAVPLVGTVSTLTITGVAATNAGAYMLRATNSVGSVVSSNANLLVQNVINVVVSNTLNLVDFVAGSTGMTTNGFKIQLSGPTGSNVVVQASTDLKNWTSISTNLVSGGSASYTDTSATNRVFRYYRAYVK